MKFGIIVSKTDKAGLLIAEKFEENGFDKTVSSLHFIEESQVFADSVNNFSEDFFVFASKHKSESKKPTLTCHAIGNWGKAELGGKDSTIVPTSAFLLRNYLLELQRQKTEKNLSFDVALECTHHGPFLSKPTVFIELGSSEEQWGNAPAAQAVAETIAKATSFDCESSVLPAIGIGGNHYCPEFSKLVLRKPFAFSHVCPEYALQNFNENLLQQAIACTREKPQLIVLDWKGLGKEKARIVELLSNQSLPVERVQNLLK